MNDAGNTTASSFRYISHRPIQPGEAADGPRQMLRVRPSLPQLPDLQQKAVSKLGLERILGL